VFLITADSLLVEISRYSTPPGPKPRGGDARGDEDYPEDIRLRSAHIRVPLLRFGRRVSLKAAAFVTYRREVATAPSPHGPANAGGDPDVHKSAA
jgi:hypothetical protein